MDLRKDVLADSSGQSTLEYVLMLVLVVMIYMGISKVVQATRIADRMLHPLQYDYKVVYRYGHLKAGPDDDARNYHPDGLYGSPGRVFINPDR